MKATFTMEVFENGRKREQVKFTQEFPSAQAFAEALADFVNLQASLVTGHRDRDYLQPSCRLNPPQLFRGCYNETVCCLISGIELSED